MYVNDMRVNPNSAAWLLTADILEFHNLLASVYEKLEKRPSSPLCDCPGKLFVRPSFSKPEMASLLCRVIVVKVEDRVLPQLSLSKHL